MGELDTNGGRSVPRPYEMLLVGLLCLNFGILFLDRNALNFLMPLVQPSLGLSNSQVGLLASVFSLTWALAGFLVGRLSDRTGLYKPILVLITFGYALCSVLSGFASGFVMLFCTRLLMGVMEGGVLPISQALTVKEVGVGRRGFAMGFMQNVGSNLLGSTVAVLLLVPLATAYGWRRAFWIAALPGLLCALLLWRYVRDPRTASRSAGEPVAQLTLAAALKDRNILVCTLISVLIVSYLVIGLVFLPLVLVHLQGLDIRVMGLLVGVLGVSAAIAGFVVPGISDYLGRKPVMCTVTVLGVAVPLAALYSHGSVLTLGAIFFFGWTIVGTFPLFMATIPSESVDAHYIATALGLIMGVGEGLGGAVAPALAGMAADRYSLAAPLWIMCCLPIGAALLALLLRETAPRRLAAMSITVR